MTGILNTALVETAFGMVRPAIEATMAAQMPDRAGVAIVVAASRDIVPFESGTSFLDRCYLVTEIGELDRSPYPNPAIALKKAELSARTGMPSASLPPHYLVAGDTVFWGSAVLGGIVVACAGLQPRHDEMFAYWIAAAVQAEARKALDTVLDANPDASFLD